MKTKKFTAITLMLAAAAATSVLGGGMLYGNIASADAQTYALTDIFSATQREDISAEVLASYSETKKVTAFTLGDDEVVWYKRNLAYKWYEAGTANYFNMAFAFKTLDFKSVTLKMDAPSVWATAEEKATNTVTFTPADGGLSVSVNGGTSHSVAYTAGAVMTFSLDGGDAYGEFKVKLGNDEIGTFTNVGASYATYSLNVTHPIEFAVDFGDKSKEDLSDKNTTIYLLSINGQDFDDVNDETKVADTAAPVLVVNEDIEAFQLGSPFSLDYKVIDVLQTSNFPSDSTSIEYYQYDPTNEVEADEFEEFKCKDALTTSTHFFQTVYLDGDVPTSVYDKAGEEYVAIRFTLGDSTFTDDDKVTYDLAWYMSSAKKVDTTKGLRASELLYIPVNENTSGATYTILTADTDERSATYQTNVKSANYQEQLDIFAGKLAEAAQDVYAGSNSYINFPSFDWLIKDNNSYSSLKFTISYKTQYTDSASTSSGLSPNAAKLSVSKEGAYEFKIFATDAAGNPMRYYLDGELVDVTTSNIWDIENIPTFEFTIKNRGLKIADSYSAESNRKDTEVLDKSYTMDSLTVVGATDLKEAYALYKVNSFAPFNETLTDATRHLRTSDLTAITYESIADRVAAKGLMSVTDGDYFGFYLRIYAELLVEQKGLDVTEDQLDLLVGCFERIGEAGDRVNSEEKYEVYEWNASSQSFATVEEGSFLIVADYWEGLAASSTRAMAYRLVEVESKKAVIKGENDWLKNNVVSVVLFSIAGVMLILIIILLMIKPSDETLEDVDAKAAGKKAKKKQTKMKAE